MKNIEGIAAIGGVEPAADVAPASSTPGAGYSDLVQSIEGPKPVGRQSAQCQEFQTDQIVIGSNVAIAGAGGLVEAYARIRLDEDSRTILIQIVNAANNEVIREIPPGAWERMKQNIQFYTGALA